MPTANCVGRNSSTLQEHKSPALDDVPHAVVAFAGLQSSMMASADSTELAAVTRTI
jgi:hypothetical protein